MMYENIQEKINHMFRYRLRCNLYFLNPDIMMMSCERKAFRIMGHLCGVLRAPVYSYAMWDWTVSVYLDVSTNNLLSKQSSYR